MTKFIICTNSAKNEVAGANSFERDAITNYLKAKGWQVWHWFEDVWLVVADPGTTVRTAKLRDELREQIANSTYILVMEVTPISFSGFGQKDGWPWMLEHWGESE